MLAALLIKLHNMPLKIILIALLILQTTTIVLQISEYPWRKCFRAEHSPDKTLEARLGIMRKEEGVCRLHWSIHILDDHAAVEEVHDQEYYCDELRVGEPKVVKHTSGGSSLTGHYQICVEVLENENHHQLIELHMGERLNPMIFSQSEASLALVQSQQIIDLHLAAQTIKRSLIKSQAYARQNREQGDQLQAKIDHMMWYGRMVTILQIVFIILFGFVWISLVGRIKTNK